MMEQEETDLADDSETTAVIEVQADGRPRSEEPSRRRASIIVISGPCVGKMVKVEESSVEVGRGDQADLRLADPGVSRSHAEIRHRQGGVFVEDLDSSNGTFLNGTEISELRRLEDGDKISLGTNTLLNFTYRDEIEESFQRKMYEGSVRDSLTGTYNKQYLSEFLRSELSYVRRHETSLSVVMFDIDQFKAINDTHGHVVGDAILVELVERVRETIRTEDRLTRYGGDEFLVVSRGTGADGAQTQGERIRDAVASTPFGHDGASIDVTVSVGVASVDGKTTAGVDELIDAADRGLYRAKQHGRNRVCRAD